MRLAWPVLLLSAVAAGCGSGMETSASCPVSQQNALEAQMDATLGQAASEVDFSFSVDRQDGRRYTYNRGGSTLQTSYESKSASKLVTAVMILRLVEQGHLALAHQPQSYIGSWPIGGITLAHLLSLTSGLTVDPDDCLNNGNSDFEDCVLRVADVNPNPNVPGQAFFYASGHLQVAGLMAIRARGFASWQDIFAEFKAQTGLFPASRYDSPSLSNPTLAGGMHFTGEDYLAFLKSLKSGQLLNSASMAQLLADRTAGIPLDFSPIFSGLPGGAAMGEDWHYGFGLWHECRSATFNCVAGTRVSSPGALGTYPFWDRSKNYTGIVVRAGAFGTFPTAIAIERSVRTTVEAWAAC
ncbi:MAG TPA: serine hydrolase domain-containing protein [Burkholderiales bacterium]|nr:serine hydrolase domain-containing protein [Burkholderiales bacterium]